MTPDQRKRLHAIGDDLWELAKTVEDRDESQDLKLLSTTLHQVGNPPEPPIPATGVLPARANKPWHLQLLRILRQARASV